MTDNPTISAVIRNIYSDPVAARLQAKVNESFVFGECRISDFEIKSYMSDERVLVGLMSARVTATINEMAEAICFSTFPVHDEPMPCLECGRPLDA